MAEGRQGWSKHQWGLGQCGRELAFTISQKSMKFLGIWERHYAVFDSLKSAMMGIFTVSAHLLTSTLESLTMWLIWLVNLGKIIGFIISILTPTPCVLAFGSELPEAAEALLCSSRAQGCGSWEQGPAWVGRSVNCWSSVLAGRVPQWVSHTFQPSPCQS